MRDGAGSRDDDTPVMARRAVHVTALLFAALLGWSWAGRVDTVAIAPGRTVASGATRIVQAADSGVVKTIRVQDGRRVRHGEVLLELDATPALARLRQLRERRRVLQQQRVVVSRVIASLPANGDTQAGAALPSVDRLTQARIDELHGAAAVLAAESRSRLAEQHALAGQVSQLDVLLPLVQERSRAAHRLQQDGMLPRMQWLELEEQRLRDEAQRAVLVERQTAAAAAAEQARARLAQHHAESTARHLAELDSVDSDLRVLRQELRTAALAVRRAAIAAPVAGVVHDLRLHTTGGAVAAGDVLLAIVPDGESLLVEARIANADVGQVRPGTGAVIRFAAWPYPRHGALGGRLVALSADAVPDERLGLVYTGRVELDAQTLASDGSALPLRPGMAVTVEFRLGRRRVIEYLLDPLVRGGSEAFREY